MTAIFIFINIYKKKLDHPRLEICPKIYTTAFFGPKIIYTKSAKIVNIFDCRI